jgi:hypothetical protein
VGGYSAFTNRNLNPYESKFFYEFLRNKICKPKLKPVPILVPVRRTCTCTFLRVTAGSKRTSVQPYKRTSLILVCSEFVLIANRCWVPVGLASSQEIAL